jgi:site-specific recombinase XerC
MEHFVLFSLPGEVITSNPMPLIGRPKVPKPLPKGLGADVISDFLAAIDSDRASQRGSGCNERDCAIVLTAVRAGLRADELLRADVADVRITDDGGVSHVRGKGNNDRRIPVGPLTDMLEHYLESMAPTVCP